MALVYANFTESLILFIAITKCTVFAILIESLINTADLSLPSPWLDAIPKPRGQCGGVCNLVISVDCSLNYSHHKYNTKLYNRAKEME